MPFGMTKDECSSSAHFFCAFYFCTFFTCFITVICGALHILSTPNMEYVAGCVVKVCELKVYYGYESCTLYCCFWYITSMVKTCKIYNTQVTQAWFSSSFLSAFSYILSAHIGHWHISYCPDMEFSCGYYWYYLTITSLISRVPGVPHPPFTDWAKEKSCCVKVWNMWRPFF